MLGSKTRICSKLKKQVFQEIDECTNVRSPLKGIYESNDVSFRLVNITHN